MKLIVFLGTPGLRYRKTRHNVGFMIGDYYAKASGLKWQYSIKFDAEIAETIAAKEKILLAKPQKFYNLSGEVVQNLIKFYKIKPPEILVVCDDLNLEFGKIRVRARGSAGGNNGLKSIIAHLGEDFARLRVGTDHELRQQIGDTDFVLSKLSREETKNFPEIAARASEIIDDFIN